MSGRYETAAAASGFAHQTGRYSSITSASHHREPLESSSHVSSYKKISLSTTIIREAPTLRSAAHPTKHISTMLVKGGLQRPHSHDSCRLSVGLLACYNFSAARLCRACSGGCQILDTIQTSPRFSLSFSNSIDKHPHFFKSSLQSTDHAHPKFGYSLGY